MIHVASARRLSSCKQRPCSSWVYIGTARGLTVASRSLSREARIFIGRMVQETSDAVRDRFVDYIGATAAFQPDRVLWYASLVASKSHSQIPTFNYYVYLKVLEALAARQEGDILVVTDDDDFMEIVGLAGIGDVHVLDVAPRWISRALEFLRGSLQIIRHVVLWCMTRTLSHAAVDGYDVIIQSWIDRRTFSDPAAFHDPYFGGLGGWLKQKGFMVGRVVPLLTPWCFMGELRKRFKEVFYPLREVTLFDLWKAITCRLEAVVPEAAGVDTRILRLLIRTEVEREDRTKAYFSNLLFFYGCRNLFKDLKRSAVVFYPFENQPWEKMLLLALPAHVTRVGYAHTIIPYNWLDYRMSRLENPAPVPNAILTIGPKWADFLRPYYPDIPVEVAGCVRHAYLLEKDKVQYSAKGKDVIVVALPIDPLISLAMQSRLLSLAEEGALAGLTVKIKTHPSLPADALLAKAFLKHVNFCFVKDNMSDLLAGCSLLITSASTVAFESLAMRVKTLVYVPESVSWGIEHFIKEDVWLAYEDDFSEKFLEALKHADSPGLKTAGFFSQPDFSVFLKYLSRTFS